MVRGTGQALSTGLPHFDTIVYSTSGLKIQQAVEQSSKVFADHDAEDLAMLQVGTCDLTVYSIVGATVSDFGLPWDLLAEIDFLV